MQLPNGFTAIKNATTVGESVNLIGVLVHYNGPRPSRGSDYVLDFTIQDDFASGSVGGESSISGRVFKPSFRFPKISGLGDVIIIRKIKLNQWNGRMECIGDRNLTSITVFPSNMIPVPDLSHAYQAGSQKLPCDSNSGSPQPTVSEQMAVIHLKHASIGSNQQVRQHATTAASKTRTSKRDTLIMDLQLNTFADIRVQVVNVYRYHGGGQVDLKVTDYTPNENLFYYADPDKEDSFYVTDRNWKGPYGFLTLNVTLYEENANWAIENVAVGDYVFIRNMRTKLSNSGKIEGVLHQDRVNASQIDIRRLTSTSEIAEIDKRREEYESKRVGMTAFEKLRSEPANPSAKTSRDKKLAKRERQRAEKEAEQQEIEKKARESEISTSGLNPNSKPYRLSSIHTDPI
jgi:protection-of-telomeres protein 1